MQDAMITVGSWDLVNIGDTSVNLKDKRMAVLSGRVEKFEGACGFLIWGKFQWTVIGRVLQMCCALVLEALLMRSECLGRK